MTTRLHIMARDMLHEQHTLRLTHQGQHRSTWSYSCWTTTAFDDINLFLQYNRIYMFVQYNVCLHCLDALGWASRRASGLQKLSDVLVWLSVWSEVQIVCIWSSWCHGHPKTPSYLTSFKFRLVSPFWYRLTQVVLEKRPLICTSTAPDHTNTSSLNLCR